MFSLNSNYRDNLLRVFKYNFLHIVYIHHYMSHHLLNPLQVLIIYVLIVRIEGKHASLYIHIIIYPITFLYFFNYL
jgi:hypothetical protein